MSPTRHHWTPAEAERRERIRALGCICCRQNVGYALEQCPSRVTINHATDGGFQIGNHAIYPACAWHHLGECLPGHTSSAMERRYGPSLAKGSKTFHAKYGTRDELLEITADLLKVAPNHWSELCSS